MAAPARTPQPASPAGGLTVGAVLGLQRTAGNQAVVRAIRGRAHVARGVPANSPACFDFNALADEIFAAVDIVGTDEQAIYHVLERFQRDPASITAARGRLPDAALQRNSSPRWRTR